ncbi:FAR1-related sequence 9 [Euphorbia peplus]|nr:FAR1-related sequence 9 [Euphorbia peplus]
MDALHEARRKVDAAKKHDPLSKENTLVTGSQQLQPCLLDQDKRIQELTAELELANRRCEAYQAKLLAVLKDMEDQKIKITVKIQNARLNLKD